MSKRKLSVTQQVHGHAAQNRPSETLGLRSSSRLNLGRATSGASALALAFAFLAPKPAAAVPFFEDVTSTMLPTPDPLCAQLNRVGCFTSWLVATDLDSDGDIDVLAANGGGYYFPNSSATSTVQLIEPSTVYLNNGTGTFTDATGPMFAGAKGRLRQVGVADLDGNGLKDVYQPAGYGYACATQVVPCTPDLDVLWMQTAPGVFEDKTADLLPPGTTSSNTPGFHFGDLDGDGDIDLVTTDWLTGRDATPVFLTLYLNDGTGKMVLAEEQQDPEQWLKTDHFPATIPYLAGAGPYWGTRAIDLDFADIDNDFDLDILVNMRNGVSRILLNDGTAHFKDGNGKVVYKLDPATGATITTGNYPAKRGPYVYNQEVCDIDNDGDLDLLLDNAGEKPVGGSGNYTQVNINDGKGAFTEKTREIVFGEVGADDNAVKCADVNNDGWYDLMVASLNSARPDKLLLSDGTGKLNNVADGIPLHPAQNFSTLGIDAADFDGDGLMDVFTGQGESGNDWSERLYRGVVTLDPATGASVGAKADTRAPIIRGTETPKAVPGEPIIVRFAVRDQVTSETGDHVKDAAIVYTTPFGAGAKVSAKFIGGDLFYAVIPAQDAGTALTITAQATDRGNRKGFGSAVTVTVKQAPAQGGSGGTGGSGGSGGTTAGTGGVVGDAGAGGEPPVAGSAGEGGVPTVDPIGGAGGEPVTEPVGGEPGTSGSSTGGSSSTGGTSSVGGEPAEGGVPSTGGTTSGGGSGGGSDDGCSVSTTASSSSGGGWLAALGLALMAGRRRRSKRSE